MTVSEAISRADSLKPNSYRTEEKIRWLSYLDGIVLEETVFSHRKKHVKPPSLIVITEDAPANVIGKPKTRYDESDLETELVAPYPYDEMYVKYIEMKIDEMNGETARYNNSATFFNNMLADYVKHYHKTHTPSGIHDFKYV